MSPSTSLSSAISGCPELVLYRASDSESSCYTSWETSWDTSGPASARRASTALLCPPQREGRERNYSLPSSLMAEDLVRTRLFSVSGGKVVSQGESIQSRRGSQTSRGSGDSSLSSQAHSRCSNPCLGQLQQLSSDLVKVLMLGAAEVGKSSLCVQFVTSEHVNTYHSVGEAPHHTAPDHSLQYPLQTTVCVKRSTWRSIRRRPDFSS